MCDNNDVGVLYKSILCFDWIDMTNKALAETKLIGRSLDKLLGICEFALMDGALEPDEANDILKWLDQNKHCLGVWPASVLYDRLTLSLQDGQLSEDEQSDLIGLIAGIVKKDAARGNEQRKALHKTGHRLPGELKADEYISQSVVSPFNQPEPEIQFDGKTFVLTGIFDFGTREECSIAIEQLGGIVNPRITKNLDYLVVGNVANDQWRFVGFGNKIMKACEYRDSGNPLVIVSENHWAKAIR